MRILRDLWFRIRSIVSARRMDREFKEEATFHLEMEIQDLIRKGMDPKGARRQAMIAFGGVDQHREAARAARGVQRLEDLVRDSGFALRSLKKRPVFAIVSILTIGLGIGATAAMFTVVNGVLLKPLSYDEPDRLVMIWQTVPHAEGLSGDDGARWDRTRLTYSQYRELLERSTLYEELAAYRAGNPDVATLTGAGDPVELAAGAATSSLLGLLGFHPVQGRWFLPGEEGSRSGQAGASVAVVSFELWQGRLGGSPETVGSTLTIDDRPFTIIGILPAGFRIHWLSASVAGEADPERRDIWFPIGAPGWLASPQGYSWETVGRLAPRVTPEQAQAETEAILSLHPHTFGDVRVLSRKSEETRGLAPPLILLFAAAALLLLVACANIATLSLAEFRGRRHEIAARSALGAGSGRLARLLLTESLLLALMGSALGVGLAFFGTEALLVMAPPAPRLHEISLDGQVIAFTLLLGVGAAVLFGGTPAVLASRSSMEPLLMGSTRTSQRRRRFDRTVIGAEIAMTAMLLVTGGLLTRSLTRLLAVDAGFDPSGLVTVEVRVPQSRYPTRESRRAFFQHALGRLRTVPGLGTVTATSRLPFPGHTSAWGMQNTASGERLSPLGYQVAPGYLETLGVPLLAGRYLAEADGPDAPLAVVINETMARRYWPEDSPLGARLDWGGSADPVTVVGIVGDMKRQVLSAETEPAFFIPFLQHPDNTICFVARTQMEPREALSLMREATRSVDADLVVKNATTVGDLVAESASRERFRTLLTNFFGILAAFLAAAGVFGVTARSVAFRTREMGIRRALGARDLRLVGNTMGSIVVVGLGGTAVGLSGALLGSSLLGRFLFGIQPWDPPTYGAVALLILLICLLASYFPSKKILRLDPRDVLNAE
ncbi:MAG: ADOP family duplicated permease, partial [Gemmatimonadota bacterium]